jgi:hypothetical protein
MKKVAFILLSLLMISMLPRNVSAQAGASTNVRVVTTAPTTCTGGSGSEVVYAGALYICNSRGVYVRSGDLSDPLASNGYQYVESTGRDSNSGLSRALAKFTIYNALCSLPGGNCSTRTAGNGIVYVNNDPATGSNMLNPTSGCGLWVMGTGDPNYASPPACWLRSPTNGGFAIVGHNGRVGHGAEATVYGGSFSDRNHPAVWLSYISGVSISNIVFGSSSRRAIILGECSNNDRTGTCRDIDISLTSVNGQIGQLESGPCIDLVGYGFWFYFRDVACNAASAYTPWSVGTITKFSNNGTTTTATCDIAYCGMGSTYSGSVTLNSYAPAACQGTFTVTAVTSSPNTMSFTNSSCPAKGGTNSIPATLSGMWENSIETVVTTLVNSPAAAINGHMTGGVQAKQFVEGENVRQTVSGAYATLIGPYIPGTPMITNPIIGTANAMNTWVGQTSGAVLSPTAAPTLTGQTVITCNRPYCGLPSNFPTQYGEIGLFQATNAHGWPMTACGGNEERYGNFPFLWNVLAVSASPMTVTIRSGRDVQAGNTTPCPSLNGTLTGRFPEAILGNWPAATSASILLDGRQGLGVGLAHIDDSSISGGGIRLFGGVDGGSVFVHNVMEEGDGYHPIPPTAWAQAGAQVQISFDRVLDADGGQSNFAPYPYTVIPPYTEVDPAVGVDVMYPYPSVTVKDSQGLVGPAQISGTSTGTDVTGTVVKSPLRQGQSGVFGHYLVGQTDVARRLAGMIPARFGNKAYSNPVSWAPALGSSGITITMGLTDPFGGTGAASASAASNQQLSFSANNQSWSGSVGDWIVGGVWVNNGSELTNAVFNVGNCPELGSPGYIESERVRGQYFGDNNWRFIWQAGKVAATNTHACMMYNVNGGATFYGPVFYFIPSSANGTSGLTDDEVIEFATTMASQDTACPVAAVCNMSGHPIRQVINNVAYPVTSTVASGTAALLNTPSGTMAINTGSCATTISVAAAGVLSTDNIQADFNTSPLSVVGFGGGSTGLLTILKWPTAGFVNFAECNYSGASITPGAMTLNWRVVR